MKKTVSIVIPAYNEEDRLPETLLKIKNYFAEDRGDFSLLEVIIVDDGSKDKTSEKAHGFEQKLPIVVITLPQNKGKGCAVRTGMLSAKGDFAFMYDADAATPIEELGKLFGAGKGGDVVIGSRVLGEKKEVIMTPFRRLVGLCFHFICSPLLPGIADASCGAKLFSKNAARQIFEKVTLDRFAFDIEALWLARRLGFKIVEIPVSWTAIPGSKVSVYRDSPEMFGSVMGILWRSLTEKSSSSKML